MNTYTPKLIKIASWLWLSYGIILSLLTLLAVYMAATNKSSEGSDKYIIWLLPTIILFFACVFLHIGKQTLKGKAKDTLGNSIGSILFALFGFNSFLGLSSSDVAEQAGYLIGPVLLLTSGIFALIGRADYKKWASGNKNA
ncbi:hypothetical protein [Shewanella oncorhynchi]|uniref:hypothetical protein n=1 Tax=Shewanella oncorhynchi TaxID=2726434 RepID=UPI003D7AE315